MTPHDPFRGTPVASRRADVDSMTYAQLRETAAELGVSTKGNKAELAARIQDRK